MKTDIVCRFCPVQGLSLFRHISAEKREKFLRFKNANTYQRGNIIFYQGNRPLGLHFICEGRIKLVKQDASGRVQIVRVIEAPDLLGDRAFFADKAYACTGEAMVDSRICFLEARHFWNLVGNEPQALRILLRKFAEELGRAHDTMHCLTVCTVKQRVAKHLLSLQGSSPITAHRQRIILEDSRTELAEFLGTTLEAISRTLGEFSAAGWIDIKGRQVKVLDENVLRRAACLHLPDIDPAESPRHS